MGTSSYFIILKKKIDSWGRDKHTAPRVLGKPPDTPTDVKLTSTFRRVGSGFEVTWNVLILTTPLS